MKIALFHNLPAGGAKRALFEHARELKARGHVLDAYTLNTADEGFLPLAPLCQNVFTYDLPPVAAAPRWVRLLIHHPAAQPAWRLAAPGAQHAAHARFIERSDPRTTLNALEALYARMATDMDARGYDWIYVHHCRLLLSPYLLRRLQTPSVYYCQDTLREAAEWSPVTIPGYDTLTETRWLRNFGGRQITRQAYRHLRERERRNTTNTRAAGLVLANSWYSREAILRTTGVNARLCYLGVDSHFFCPDPQANGREQGTVLSVGSFHPAKGHEFILESLATIPQARRPALHVIGHDIELGKQSGGTYADALRQLAAARGVTLTVSHEVSDEALRAAYQRAAVVAFAPYLEPFGLIPLEAFACATPVVGVSEGGVRETVQHNVTGLLTERDPAAFGAAVEQIVCDARLAREFAANGRAAVQDLWTWRRSADTLESLAATLLAA